MKATILIKNIASLYLCDDQFTVYQNAFLALHHDHVMTYGNGDYLPIIDDATRIIDARGETVIPAFVDCSFAMDPMLMGQDLVRKENDILNAMKKNGILTVIARSSKLQRSYLDQEVLISKKELKYPVISSLKEYIDDPSRRFLLSCGFSNHAHKAYSMQPLAFSLQTAFDVSIHTLLKAMTCWPAKQSGFKHIGTLKKGSQADVLVLRCHTIEDYFKTEGMDLIHWMIKKGIPVYPYIFRA